MSYFLKFPLEEPVKLVYRIISFCMSLKPNINQVYNNAPMSPDKLPVCEYNALATL